MAIGFLLTVCGLVEFQRRRLLLMNGVRRLLLRTNCVNHSDMRCQNLTHSERHILQNLMGIVAPKNLYLYSRKLLKQEKVTFLYGAKDTEHNNAVVLVQWLDKRL